MKKQICFWIAFFGFLGIVLTGCTRAVKKPVSKTVPVVSPVASKPSSASSKVPAKATPSEVALAVTNKPIPQSLPPKRTKFVTPSGKAAVTFEMIHFAFDKYNLTQPDRKILTGIGQYLLNHPGIMVLLQGYCDERGTQQYNLVLGEQRALSARTFLIGLGVSPKRLFTISYGKEDPINPAHNEIAWAENRRVEFKISK
ncbi:MAG: OmpA family protein [Candidatus Omnitrophica bacterium]|nr:OmpA family protein [Candidatus Omnitrophota bacterium]